MVKDDETGEEMIADLDVAEMVRRAMHDTTPPADGITGESDKPEDDDKQPEDKSSGKAPETDKPAKEPKGEHSGEEDGETSVESPLLQKARELGLGTFKTEEEFLEGQKQLRNRLSQRDDEAAFGRFVREKGFTPDRLEALTKPKGEEEAKPQRKKGFAPPVPHNPAWDHLVKPKHDEDGNVVGYTGPAEMVRDYEAHDAYVKDYWRQVTHNPAMLADAFEDRVEAKIAEREKARMEMDREEQAKKAVESFMDKNSTFVAENEKPFFDLVGRGMDPETAVEYLKEKAELATLRKGLPATNGADAKKKDREAEIRRSAQRAGAKVSPVRTEKDTRKMTPREIFKEAMAQNPDADLMTDILND